MTAGRPDYTSQALIKGNCTGVGILTVAVDSSGNILGVLKGDYAGTLKTLAVDGQGRMLAVLTDPEDVFGNPHYMGAAELAARGGYRSLYRQGQVVFYDEGGSALNMYTVTTSGASSAVSEDATYGHLIPKSYKFVTGPNDGDYAQIDKYLPVPAETAQGLEVMFSIDLKTKYVELLLDGQGLGYYKQGRLRYNTHDLRLEYFNSAGAWATWGGIQLSDNNHQPHSMKLVINPTTGMYVRWQLDQYNIPTGSTPLYQPVSGYDKRLQAQVNIVCHDGGAATAYVSNIAITCNEV